MLSLKIFLHPHDILYKYALRKYTQGTMKIPGEHEKKELPLFAMAKLH